MKRLPRLGAIRLPTALAIGVGGAILFFAAILIFDVNFLFDMRGDAFVAWAKRNSIPMTPPQSDDTLAPVRALIEQIGPARVIGLGESTLGTHEFAVIRSSIIQAMADRGITDVIFNAGFEPMRAIDTWVQGGSGDGRQLLIAQHFWSNDTPEYLALLEWLRAWNAYPGRTRHIHVRGMSGSNLGEALRCVSDYAQRSNLSIAIPDSVALRLRAAKVSSIVDTGGISLSAQVAASNSTDLDDAAALDSLASSLEAARARRSIAPSEPEFAVARHCVELASGRYGMLATRPRHTNLGGAEDSLEADEVAWWLSQSGPRSRAIVLSTNRHVAADASFQSPISVGTRLRSMFGNGYVPIGLFFGAGEFSAIATGGSYPFRTTSRAGTAPVNWFEGALSRVSTSAFALDLRTAPHFGTTALYLWMQHTSREIEAVYNGAWAMRKSSPRGSFDLVVYVPTSSPTRSLVDRPAQSEP